MQLVGGMAYSDAFVLDALKKLIAELGDDAVISHARIARKSGVPLRTCQDALTRLKDADRIESTFTIGVGYRYKVKERNGAASPAG